MATFIKGEAVANATSYELLEKTDGGYNSLLEASAINFEVSAMGFEPGDHTLVVKAKAAGYTDSDVSNEVVYSVETAPADNWVDITDQFNFTERRMVNSSNGTVSTWDGWVATDDYVDLSAYSEIEIKMSKTNSVTTSTGLAFYDASKAYVSGIAHTDGVATYGTMIKNIKLTADMVYIKTTYWSTANASYKTEFGDFYCKAKKK